MRTHATGLDYRQAQKVSTRRNLLGLRTRIENTEKRAGLSPGPEKHLPAARLLRREQIGHCRRARVASMVQAGQSKSAFQRTQEREVGVELCALHLMDAVIRFYNRNHLVRDWRHAVVVLVPNNNDRGMAVGPDR